MRKNDTADEKTAEALPEPHFSLADWNSHGGHYE
jgi:hypothetical protein